MFWFIPVAFRTVGIIISYLVLLTSLISCAKLLFGKYEGVINVETILFAI